MLLVLETDGFLTNHVKVLEPATVSSLSPPAPVLLPSKRMHEFPVQLLRAEEVCACRGERQASP